MKKKKQKPLPIVPTIPYADSTKKIRAILIIAFISVIGILLVLLSLRNTHQVSAQPQVSTQPQPIQNPGVTFLSLKDQPYLQLGSTILVPLKKKDWEALTNAFPEGVKKQTMNFSK